MSNNKFNFSEENKQAMEQARKREIRMEILFSLNSKKSNPRMGELIARYIEGDNPELILEKLKAVGIKEIINRGFYYDHKDAETFSWIKTIIDSMLRSEELLIPELILEFIDVIGIKKVLFYLNRNDENRQNLLTIMNFLLNNQSIETFLQIMQAIDVKEAICDCCSHLHQGSYEVFIDYILEKFLLLANNDRAQLVELARCVGIKEIVANAAKSYSNEGFKYFIQKMFANQTSDNIQAMIREFGIKDVVQNIVAGQKIETTDRINSELNCNAMNIILAAYFATNHNMSLDLLKELGLDSYVGKLVRLHALTKTYDYEYEDQVKFIKMLVDTLVSTTDNETLDQNLITILGIKELLVINKDHDVFVYLLESCLPKDDHCLTQSLIELLGIKELLYKSYVAYAHNGHGDEDFIYLLDLMIPKTQKHLDLELIKASGLKDFITRSAEPKSYGKTELYARDQFLHLLEKCLPQPTTELNLQVIQLLGLRNVIAQVPDYQKAKIVTVILKQLKSDTQAPKIMAELGITPEDIKQFVRAAVENDMDDALKEIVAGPFNAQLIDELDLDACVVVGARQGRLKALEFIVGKYLTDGVLSPELIEKLRIKDAIIAAGAGGQPSTLIYLLEKCMLQPNLDLPQVINLLGINQAVQAFVVANKQYDQQYNSGPDGVIKLVLAMCKKIPKLIVAQDLLRSLGIDQEFFNHAMKQCIAHECGSVQDLRAIIKALPRGVDGNLSVETIRAFGLREMIALALQKGSSDIFESCLEACGNNQESLTALLTNEPLRFITEMVARPQEQAAIIRLCANNRFLPAVILKEMIVRYLDPTIADPANRSQNFAEPIKFIERNHLGAMTIPQLVQRTHAPREIMEAMVFLINDRRARMTNLTTINKAIGGFAQHRLANVQQGDDANEAKQAEVRHDDFQLRLLKEGIKRELEVQKPGQGNPQ